MRNNHNNKQNVKSGDSEMLINESEFLDDEEISPDELIDELLDDELEQDFKNVENGFTEEDVIYANQTNAEKEAVIGLTKSVGVLSKLTLILAIGCVLIGILACIGFYRRPKVLVAVTTPDGRRVVKIDDVNFGVTEPIQMGKDNLNNEDKKYLVNEFLNRYYGVDLATRQKDLQTALGMMIPSSAKKLFKALNDQGYLQAERDEAWASTWETEKIEVSANDPKIVEVIGIQSLKKRIGSEIKEEKIQYKVLFQLFTEGDRENTPLRTGYWIVQFKADTISKK